MLAQLTDQVQSVISDTLTLQGAAAGSRQPAQAAGQQAPWVAAGVNECDSHLARPSRQHGTCLAAAAAGVQGGEVVGVGGYQVGVRQPCVQLSLPQHLLPLASDMQIARQAREHQPLHSDLHTQLLINVQGCKGRQAGSKACQVACPVQRCCIQSSRPLTCMPRQAGAVDAWRSSWQGCPLSLHCSCGVGCAPCCALFNAALFTRLPSRGRCSAARWMAHWLVSSTGHQDKAMCPMGRTAMRQRRGVVAAPLAAAVLPSTGQRIRGCLWQWGPRYIG
ncbi:hypothetical protein V8C86DRAFT_2571898 [Haematococcus lacustris]